MAHDFLGTFTKSQFERFIAFARSQLPLIKDRIRHLDFETARMGTIAFTFEGGVPVESSKETPAQTYIGKLVAAYEVLGGNPFHDLRVRHQSQPVYVVRGTEQDPAQYMSNGEVIGARGLADGPSALLMQQARGWMDDTLQARFDRLERKIRRAIDYVDQLQAEKAHLQVIQSAATTIGSLEQIESAILDLIADTNYRAIYDDGGNDPFGFTAYAPFSSYEGPDAEADPNLRRRKILTAQRGNKGFEGPEEGLA